ncbi:hypothetical protein FDZ74_11500 [bacterium]|nr:MAG: hypothetical protein FDZ74_11500 [bacterium]
MRGKNITLAQGEGRLRVEISAAFTGNGISVLLTGGETPHVGGVVMCVPRPGLSGEGTGCDSFVLPVPGHKDTLAAQPLAEMICRRTGQVTVVVGGIHIKNAQSHELDKLLQNSMEAGRRLIEKCTE